MVEMYQLPVRRVCILKLMEKERSGEPEAGLSGKQVSEMRGCRAGIGGPAQNNPFARLHVKIT